MIRECVACERRASDVCARCGCPLCVVHAHDEASRCDSCENDFRRRLFSPSAILASAAATFGPIAGGAALLVDGFVAFGGGLLLFGMACGVAFRAMTSSENWMRKRFLAERAPALPTARVHLLRE